MMILASVWQALIYQPILTALIFLNGLFNNFGVAIILLTTGIKFLLWPVNQSALRKSKQLMDLQPEVKKLQEQYKDDKKKHQEETLRLYKERGVNPAGGCLPQLVQVVFLIALYQVFIDFLKQNNGPKLNTIFFIFDLAKSDKTYILPFLAAATQMLMGLMLQPVKAEDKDSSPNKEEKKEDIAQTMQLQMLFLGPFMTFFIARSFPSGLALYWVISTVFGIIQQYLIFGWGGLGRIKPIWQKILNK